MMLICVGKGMLMCVGEGICDRRGYGGIYEAKVGGFFRGWVNQESQDFFGDMWDGGVL